MSRLSPADSLRVVQAIAAQSLTTTTNGTGVDCRGYEHVLVVVNFGTLSGTSPTADVTIQQSSDNGSSDAYAAVTGAAFAQVTTSNDVAVYVGELRCEELERYLRPVVTITGTSPVVPISIDFVLSGGKYLPVSGQTASFSVPAIS